MKRMAANLPVWTARSPLMVPGSAWRGLVAPINLRADATTPSPSQALQDREQYCSCELCIGESVELRKICLIHKKSIYHADNRTRSYVINQLRKERFILQILVMLLREKEGWTRQYMKSIIIISELIQHNEVIGPFWCEKKHYIVCTNKVQKKLKKGWLDSVGFLVNVKKKDESVKLMKKRDAGNVFYQRLYKKERKKEKPLKEKKMIWFRQ